MQTREDFEADLAQLAATTHRRLNVGCGLLPLNYYENLDASPDMKADIHADAIEYLRSCDEGRYDEIYAGHFLEHLTRDDATTFLAECYRVLSPGGHCGIVVPDMLEVMKHYVNKEPYCIELPEEHFWSATDLDHMAAIIIYATVQESHHKWCYDRDTLARAMIQAGFRKLKEIDRYRDPRLADGAWYQVGWSGLKLEGGE